ncbi:hypothetical protein [Roseiflexus castenholzii]|uniref:hypothetical protein n=1 Tax=Roseiflexus castenholzii TaxID=120962 RepID=UPI003C7C1E47
MATKTIAATMAQNNSGRVLDDVIQNDLRYVIKRRSLLQAILLIRMRGHSCNTAVALRAKAPAEDAVRRCSPQVKAPLGLLMTMRGHNAPTDAVR